MLQTNSLRAKEEVTLHLLEHSLGWPPTGVILGFISESYGDNGKENGSYHLVVKTSGGPPNPGIVTLYHDYSFRVGGGSS